MKTSLIFYPNESKQNPKTLKVPIYLRLIHRRTKAESRLNAELKPEDLLKWNRFTMRLQERNSTINFQLNNIDQEFRKFIMMNETSLSKFNATQLRDLVLGNNQAPDITIRQYLENYFLKSVLPNSALSDGTKRNYKKSLTHLYNFLTLQKVDACLLKEIDVSFAGDFRDYLINDDPMSLKRGISEVSASDIIKKFRTIFDRAVDQGLLIKNPFKKIKLKTKSPRRDRLNIFQVQNLYKTDLSDHPNLILYRDIFLFSIFTGLAYKDAMSLTSAHLTQMGADKIKVSTKRAKTDVGMEQFLVEPAIKLVEKYKNHREVQIRKTILPVRSNKEVNLILKILAEKCEISIKLTTHIARHTFRQLLSEAGIEDHGIIKRMMGQSRRGDVDEVYYLITDSRLIEAKTKFENYLNTYLL